MDPGADLLTGHAERIPDKVAFVEDEPGRAPRSITFAEFNGQANRIANALRRSGTQPGDHVAWLGRNSIDVVTFAAGAVKAGCTPVPMNHRVQRGEAIHLLNTYKATFVWAAADLVGVLDDIERDTSVRHVVAFGDSAHGRTDASEFLAGVPRTPPPAVSGAASDGAGGFTSGTTGKPKRVLRDPVKDAAASPIRYIDQIWTGENVFITCGAISSGSSGGYYANAVRHGDTTVLQAKFDPVDWLRLVDKYRVTIAYMSPAVCRRVCTVPDEVKSRYDVSSIRAVYAGAAKWSHAVKLMYRDTFPQDTLWEVYGSTELGWNLMMRPDQHWDRPGSSGRPVADVDVVLRDDTGQIVTEPYGRGVLYCKGGYCDGFLGYENDPAATAEATWGEYRTVGDIAYFDEDGFFYICDRAKDMIVSGGVNIFPQEIEAVIDSHPGVVECAVFGIPDEEWGERVHATVVARPGRSLTADDITSFCRDRLSSDKVPRSVEMAADLPHTLSGKVLKRQLRDVYWAGSGRQI